VPLYEYQCQKCRHRFEKIQKFSDAPLKKCPECGGKVEKLISAPAVQFKGSGWYVTDYAKKSGTPSSTSKSSEDGSSSSASDSSASEAKEANPKKESADKKSSKK
jgi:putative FmdB family regulatory protein